MNKKKFKTGTVNIPAGEFNPKNEKLYITQPKEKTIAEVLKTCKLNDVVSDKVRQWKIVDMDFDGAIIAQPIKWKKAKMGSPFELWSLGIESVAIIPGLHKVSPVKHALVKAGKKESKKVAQKRQPKSILSKLPTSTLRRLITE